MLIRAPAFTDIGLYSDDYVQHAMLTGAYPAARSPLDLFNFASGSEEESKLLKNYGAIPWWTHPQFRLAMMRPLSSALIGLDYRLFKNNLIVAHTHSMIWWVFLIFAVAYLLRKILPPVMALLAIVLFTVEQSHGLPSIWLANRNALVSLVFSTLGLLAHINWRQSKRLFYSFTSFIFFSIALLAGEWTFPILAYVFAFEVFNRNESLTNRFYALLPITIICLIFITVQHLLIYSALNSSIYINPITEPIDFSIQVVQKIPVFLANLVFGIPPIWYQEGNPWQSKLLSLHIFSPEVWKALPSWSFWHVLIGIIGGIISIIFIRFGLRRQNVTTKQELHWLILGGLISLLPMVASAPTTRLVLPASIGFSAICSAILLASYSQLVESIRIKRYLSTSVAIVILAGVLYTQIWQPIKYAREEIETFVYFFESFRQWIIQADMEKEKFADQHVFMINGAEHTSVVFAPYVWNYHGFPMPRSCHILSAARKAHYIKRTAINKLEYTVIGGTLLGSSIATFYRSSKFPFKKGDKVILDEFQAKILGLLRGKPVKILFSFNKPLDHPSYHFLVSSKTGLRRFIPPNIGKRVVVPRPTFPNLYSLFIRKR